MASKLIRVISRPVTAEEKAICDAALERHHIRIYGEADDKNPSYEERAASHALYSKEMRDIGVLCLYQFNGLRFIGIFSDSEWPLVRWERK